MTKKKGRNAFYFFMLDWKKRMEATGRTFPNGLKDVQLDPLCNDEWTSMPKHEKGYYISKSKDSKVSEQGNWEKKTTLGESIREIEENTKKQEEFEQTMQEYIDSIVSMGIKHNNLGKMKFIFMHVNYFFMKPLQNNQYEYFPAEFAIAKFSLENGIESIYHEIISTKIPMGYKRDALEHSQKSHKIPVELPEGESDYGVMFDKLIDFLEPNKTGSKYPPIFSARKDFVIYAADSLLNKMTEAANTERDMFLLYSLEHLFCALHNAAALKTNASAIPVSVGDRPFIKEIFFSARGLECDFHKIIDDAVEHCSVFNVKQWGFTICDYCCEALDIDRIPGVHIPMCYSQSTMMKLDEFETQFTKLAISKPATIKTLSMTGVSEEHRLKTSERSYAEEQERRRNCKPLEIIDHSKQNEKPILVSSSTPAPLTGRPLRPPKTTPYALVGVKDESPSINEMNFPPLGGRGVMLKKKVEEFKRPLGRGHGSR